MVTSFDIDPVKLEKMNEGYQETYREIENKEVRFENYMMDDAEIGIVAFGATSRSAKESVDALRSMGIKVGLFRPITIWPFAEKKINEISKKMDKLFVVEMNLGQYVNEVKRASHKGCNVEFLGKIDGNPIAPSEINDFVRGNL